MEDDDELLPGEQLLEREILGQAEIMVGLIGVDIDVLILETIEDMIDEGLDLLSVRSFPDLTRSIKF